MRMRVNLLIKFVFTTKVAMEAIWKLHPATKEMTMKEALLKRQ